MTDRQHAPPTYPSPYDRAIAQHVEQLLEDRRETVLNLAHYTGISLAALYRKLGGGARWSAADAGRIAEHFGVLVGELFAGAPAANVVDPAPPPAPSTPRVPAAALTDPFRVGSPGRDADRITIR